MRGNRGSHGRIDGRREGTCDINDFIEMRGEREGGWCCMLALEERERSVIKSE